MKKIRFDTRDTKPKLYNLLIITVAAVMISALTVIINPGGGAGIACCITSVYCLFAAGILFYSFREQMRYNPYSYNTIFYFGFAVFALFVAATHIYLAVRIFSQPEAYTASAIIHTLLDSAKNYMIVTSPFVFAFSAALCVSNISLIVHEGFRPVNLLGIILSALLVTGDVFLFVSDFSASGSQNEVMIHDLLINLFAAVYLYVECMIIGTIVADAITARYEPDKDIDIMIILGCGLNKDGTPTPLLRGRVMRAIKFYKDQKEQTGKELIFITSGGKGTDERNSESAAMKSCLLENGIPESIIVEEDKSTTTYENMKFSKEKIAEINKDAKIAFSTTNFHVFRSGFMARRFHIRAEGVGAETKWYYWPNAAVREFAGLLINHRLKQAIILFTMAAIYAGLTVLAYNI